MQRCYDTVRTETIARRSATLGGRVYSEIHKKIHTLNRYNILRSYQTRFRGIAVGFRDWLVPNMASFRCIYQSVTTGLTAIYHEVGSVSALY